jgi:riboflavin synthase
LFSGHFVQGHVDTTVKILSVVPDPPNSLIYTFEIDKEWARYVVGKGYVCLDGTSLTVVEVGKGVFSIMLIEYTQGKVIMTGKKVCSVSES